MFHCIANNCGKPFRRDMLTKGGKSLFAYCEDCVDKFRAAQAKDVKEREPKGSGAVKWFSDPAGKLRRDDCPVSVLYQGTNHCGLCGSCDQEEEYGLSPFGIGTFNRCGGCKMILDFVADTGE